MMEFFSRDKFQTAACLQRGAPDFMPKSLGLMDRGRLGGEGWEAALEAAAKKLNTELVVLKAPHLCCGAGIAYLPVDKLAEGLKFLLQSEGYSRLSSGSRQHQLDLRLTLGLSVEEVRLFQSEAAGQDFLLQEYVAGLPIQSKETGFYYDPTMRFILGIVRFGDKVALCPLDAYWKLPAVALGGGYKGIGSSNCYRGEKALPVSSEDFEQTWHDLLLAFRGTYPAMLEHWTRHYRRGRLPRDLSGLK
jgi:hypothetical protein